MGWAETEAAIARRRLVWDELEVARKQAEADAPLATCEVYDYGHGSKRVVAGVTPNFLGGRTAVLVVNHCYLDREGALALARWLLATLE